VSELASEVTVDASAEVVLCSLEVVLGSLPVLARGCRGRSRAEGVVVVGDGVVEAVGLDALGGLPPGAPGSQLIGKLTE
jgi:hypothetical protein